MRDTTRDAKGGGRREHGHISSTGAVSSGTSVYVVRVGAGQYVVNFYVPYPMAPDVFATAYGGVGDAVADAFNEAPNQFQVNTYVAGALADHDFNFEAMEATR